jgi:hypothetical protein
MVDALQPMPILSPGFSSAVLGEPAPMVHVTRPGSVWRVKPLPSSAFTVPT